MGVALLALAGCGQGNVFELSVGDCFDDPSVTEQVSDVPLVDCAEPHHNEVFEVFELADGDHPGVDAVEAAAGEGCLAAFEPFVGAPYATSELYLGWLSPTEDSWDGGDREVVCYLYEPGVRLEGSMAGAAR